MCMNAFSTSRSDGYNRIAVTTAITTALIRSRSAIIHVQCPLYDAARSVWVHLAYCSRAGSSTMRLCVHIKLRHLLPVPCPVSYSGMVSIVPTHDPCYI
jgi:hypothetical protein